MGERDKGKSQKEKRKKIKLTYIVGLKVKIKNRYRTITWSQRSLKLTNPTVGEHLVDFRLIDLFIY